MKRIKSFLFLFCFLYLALSFTSKTIAGNSSKHFFIRPWAVGQSLTFQTKNYLNGSLNNTEVVSYSIVGEEEIKGKKYFWLEIERDELGGVTIVQKLQILEPKPIDFEKTLSFAPESGILISNNILKPRRKIQKIVLTGPKSHSSVDEFEISASSVSQIENNTNDLEKDDPFKLYATSSDDLVNVQAGTFQTIKFSLAAPPTTATPTNNQPFGAVMNGIPQFCDIWGSPEIPIWGIVKKSSRTNLKDFGDIVQQTELLSYLETGAVSKIKESPRFIPLAQRKKTSKEIFGQDPELFHKQE